MSRKRQASHHAEINRWTSENMRKGLREAIAAYDAAILRLRTLSRAAREDQRTTCKASVAAARYA